MLCSNAMIARKTLLPHAAFRFARSCWLAVLLCSCATAPPFDYPKTASFALEDTGQTPLGQAVAAWTAEHPGKSGIHLLTFGIDAFATRLDLIEAAQRSVNIQTFLLHDDVTGNLLLATLLEAADRGVHVRFLLDDIETADLDNSLAALDYHPNIEIRLFNPFPAGISRSIRFAKDFSRLNRRMHNKSLTVDNQVTIVGGRNMADEYYQADPAVRFLDQDLLAIGLIAADVSAVFDEYWNSAVAVPIEAYEGLVTSDTQADGRAHIAAKVAESKPNPYSEQLNKRVIGDFLDKELVLYEADARVMAELPEKALAAEAGIIMAPELARMGTDAESEIILISPYFVPQADGVEYLVGIRNSGVRITIITNSLASTNKAVVHGAYAHYRKPLLEAGIDLYEINANTGSVDENPAGAAVPHLTLHSKTILIDRKTLFVGSFNLDPRSANINTEMGLVAVSSELSNQFADNVTSALPLFTYKLRLSDKNKLEWVADGGESSLTYTKEPDTGAWRRFSAWFLGLFPIEEQL
jgi:putative cardiolipin synthase